MGTRGLIAFQPTEPMSKASAASLVVFFLLGQIASTAHATSFPVTLPDGLGSTITISRPPNRIVSLAPNITEILFAVGAGDRVVGVTRFCNYPPEAARRAKVGGYTDIAIEAVLALSPDLVVASRGNPKRTLARLSEYGLPILAIDPQSIEEVKQAILLIGRATGDPSQAEAVCRRMERTLAEVRKALAGLETRRRVYFGSLTAPYVAAGPAGFIGRCIDLAGGENIAPKTSDPWPNLPIETILTRDPEVVIEGFHGGRNTEEQRRRLLERLRADPVWSRISAVRSGRVFVLDDDTIHRPGPRLAQAVADLARLLYPERFPVDGHPKSP